jgi:hypothetical protein
VSNVILSRILKFGLVLSCGILVLLRMVLSPLVAGELAMAQEKPIIPDLKALAEGKGGTILVDATLKWVEDAKGKPAIRVQPNKDGTIVLLDRIEFTNGVIEFDVLGQSAPFQSNFLGFAFRVVDARNHDAVYFRPFNFRAEEAERKAHAVQYVSHPKYPWQVLRKEKPGQYEKPIVPAPDGDVWFHVRIVVEKPKVSVYVNDGKEPSLVVDELSDRKGGGVGLWVVGRGGHFANVKITPAKPALSGAWGKKDGKLTIEFADHGIMKIAPHGDSACAVVCSYRAEKDGLLKVKITGFEGNEETKKKLQERVPVGLKFTFKWKVNGDAARLDDLMGEHVEMMKSQLEGDFEQKK